MGSVIRLSMADLPAALESADENMRRAIAYGARAGAERGRALLVKRTPVDLGQLKASWKVKAGAGEVFATTIGDSETELATLINDAPNIAVVELGARPHKVSAEGWAAIYEWARRHYRNAGGRMRARPRNPGPARDFTGPDPVIVSITWGIVRKIGRVGQRATLFVFNSLDEVRNLMAFEVRHAIDLAMRNAARAGGA